MPPDMSFRWANIAYRSCRVLDEAFSVMTLEYQGPPLPGQKAIHHLSYVQHKTLSPGRKYTQLGLRYNVSAEYTRTISWLATAVLGALVFFQGVSVISLPSGKLRAGLCTHIIHMRTTPPVRYLNPSLHMDSSLPGFQNQSNQNYYLNELMKRSCLPHRMAHSNLQGLGASDRMAG